MPALPAYQGPASAPPRHAAGDYAAGVRPPTGQAISPEDIVAGGGSPMWSVVSSLGLPGQPQKHVSRPFSMMCHEPTI